MGILVFVLAIVPQSKDNSGASLHILRAESPGPSVGKLTSKMRQTARILYAIYITMTALEILMLFAGGMPLFDSVVNSFATAGTGGFAIKNISIGAYDSYYLQAVIGVFMLLFGVNFNIFHLLLLREYSKALHNEELKLYFGIVGVSVAIITINIHSMFSSWYEALHHSFFQVASIITTTGFSTVDFNLWPELSKFILVILMIIGACAGSTGGGLKVARVLILIKALRNEVQKMVHPRCVKIMKIDGKVQSDRVIHSVAMYSIVYVLIMIISMLIVSIDNFNFTTTTTAVISCLNNIGPGLDIVGPMGNFSDFSVLSKITLIANMIIGRLEIFPVVILFSPSLWKRCN